jgi:hypothetical protein
VYSTWYNIRRLTCTKEIPMHIIYHYTDTESGLSCIGKRSAEKLSKGLVERKVDKIDKIDVIAPRAAL